MADDTDEETPKPVPHRRGVGLAGITLIVAIVAFALAAWSTWRMQHALDAAAAERTQGAAALAGLQQQLAASDQQVRTGDQRVANLASGVEDLRADLRGLERRTANLETAFANLNGQQRSGRDTLLLNNAEMLLRMGQQRYELFHDSHGALQAYSQAIETLAQVQNPAYAPVRAGATTERDALAAAAPPSRQAALGTLSTLRGEIATLPFALPQAETTSEPQTGFWSRVAQAFSGVVTVRHDGSAPPRPDNQFARATLALDLAQAQEALLVFDHATWRAALQRADKTLSNQFDNDDPAVRKARSEIASMLAQRPPAPVPQLGGALAQLESLRANRPPARATPASAASTGSGQP